MALIKASVGSSLDLLETAISSLLTPEITWIDPTLVRIDFDHGFSDAVEGSGLVIDADGQLVSGTITRIAEYRDGVVQFTISDMAVSAASLWDWLMEGNYQSVMLNLLSGPDLITGSDLADRLYASDGNDTIKGAAGDDEIDGGAGNDNIYGGAGDDYIYGGSGTDEAYSNGLFSRYALRSVNDGLELAGPAEDGTDILIDVEKLHFKDGILTIDPEAPGSAIVRLYDAVLHRVPQQEELESWLDQVESGMSLNQIATYFLNAAEFKVAGTDVAINGAFVDFLYRQTLGRDAEPTGNAYWTGLLAGGLSRSDALLFFSESIEHKHRTAEQTQAGYFETDDGYQTIALLYDSFADRLPDTAGLIHWGDQLNAGTRSISDVASLFAASSEFGDRTAGMSHAQIVDYMYLNTLGREGDAGGRASWIAALGGGMTEGDLLLGFALSAEHQSMMTMYITGGIDVFG